MPVLGSFNSLTSFAPPSFFPALQGLGWRSRQEFFSWLIPEASIRFRKQPFLTTLTSPLSSSRATCISLVRIQPLCVLGGAPPFLYDADSPAPLIGGTAYSSIIKKLSHFTYDTIPAWVPVHQHFMTCWDYARSSALRYFYPRRHVVRCAHFQATSYAVFSK